MEIKAVILALAIPMGVAAQAQEQWDGFYGGISLDYSHTHGSVAGTTGHTYGARQATIPGLYFGRNYDRGNGFVWGPEIALSSIDLKGSQTNASHGTTGFSGRVLISPRVRAGFATGNFLFYGTLGLGITNAGVKPAGATGKDWNIGASYGMGVEMALQNGWSTRLDAMSHDLGGRSYDYGGTQAEMGLKLKTISLGLTKRF